MNVVNKIGNAIEGAGKALHDAGQDAMNEPPLFDPDLVPDNLILEDDLDQPNVVAAVAIVGGVLLQGVGGLLKAIS